MKALYRAVSLLLWISLAFGLPVVAVSEDAVVPASTPVLEDGSDESDPDEQENAESPKDMDDEQGDDPEREQIQETRSLNTQSAIEDQLDIVWVEWFGHSVAIELWGWTLPAPGEFGYLTYDPSVILFDETPVPIFFEDWDTYEQVALGVAQANNDIGVVTFVMYEYDPEVDWDAYTWLYMPATLQNIACEPGDPSNAGTTDLTFVHHTGYVWESSVPSGICNGTPASISGSWIDNETIRWTIDSGDLFNQGILYWYAPVSPGSYECNDIVFEPGVGTQVHDPSCYSREMAVGFSNDQGDITRTGISIDWSVGSGSTASSYIACVNAFSSPAIGLLSTEASHSNGVEYYECYELFPPDGGDFLTKSVDKTEAESGDAVTFTVTVETTSPEWSAIDVTDTLPDGFELTSVTCTVEPVRFQGDSCYTIENGTITSGAVPEQIEEGYAEAGPVVITLIIEGTVAGEAGTTIVNEACSVRTFAPQSPVIARAVGDPTIPGGGVICDTAAVTIVSEDNGEGPDPDPEPTETNEPDPEPTGTNEPDPDPTETNEPDTGTGTPIPGVTPTTTADSTATSAVTGLPETGSAGGHSGVVVLASLLAASVLMVAALGMRLHSSRG